jgi:hypothetical protein
MLWRTEAYPLIVVHLHDEGRCRGDCLAQEKQVVRLVKRNNKNRGLRRPFKVRPGSQSKEY